MTDAWIGWTLDECEGEGSAGANTRAVFSGEAEAVTSFVNGLSRTSPTIHGPAAGRSKVRAVRRTGKRQSAPITRDAL